MKAVESDGTMAPIEPWAESGQNCKYISQNDVFWPKKKIIKSKRTEVPLISNQSSRWVDYGYIMHFDVLPKKIDFMAKKHFFKNAALRITKCWISPEIKNRFQLMWS